MMSALMLVFMFSLAGIPPTAGFVAKFSVFMAVIRAGYTPLALIGVVFSVVSAFFYLRVVVLMYMKEPRMEIPLTTSLPLKIVLATTAAAIGHDRLGTSTCGRNSCAAMNSHVVFEFLLICRN